MEPLYIVKIGGNVIDEETKLSSLLNQFAGITGKKMIVHGGGKLATKLAEKLGIPQQLIDGRRITDAETLKIVTMVYAGYINKNIVALLQAIDCNAVGICGADGNIIQAHKRNHPTIDYGYAGDVDTINISLLNCLLQQNIAVVVAPITHDKNGQLLNTNADTIAGELAKALSSAFEVTLVFAFEKNGVLLDAGNNDTVVPFINPDSYKTLKDNHAIFAGMIPKLDNAFAALNSGVKQVVIGNSEQLAELITNSAGTKISNEKH